MEMRNEEEKLHKEQTHDKSIDRSFYSLLERSNRIEHSSPRKQHTHLKYDRHEHIDRLGKKHTFVELEGG